jgi:hypothetical protein
MARFDVRFGRVSKKHACVGKTRRKIKEGKEGWKDGNEVKSMKEGRKV